MKSNGSEMNDEYDVVIDVLTKHAALYGGEE